MAVPDPRRKRGWGAARRGQACTRGQSPKAFVKLKAGVDLITFDEMKRFLSDKLGKHEMIGALEIRAELPKTPVGKLSKKELYEEEERKRAAAA